MVSYVLMKTSVELDDKKVALARKLAPVSTLRELIDLALESYISQARRNSMLDLLGSGFFDGNLDEMREKRGRTRR